MMRGVTALAAVVFAFTAEASATTVTADVTPLGGNVFEAAFAVDNSTLGQSIEEFTIFLPPGDYAGLSIVASPADWDGLAIQPDPGIPDDGFFDWLATGAPLAAGDGLAGFVARFTFQGAGLPGNWVFQVVDPITFAVLASGSVAVTFVSTEVPLPAGFWLFATSLAAGALRSASRKRKAIL